MPDQLYALIKASKNDNRYSLEAYLFVQEALQCAVDSIELDKQPMDAGHDTCGQHMTGQQLCEGFRHLALAQFGYMAKTVINNWGIYSTEDIGEIVFNMFKVGVLKKSSNDRKSHFANVYDFDQAFVHDFTIAPNLSNGIHRSVKHGSS